jgi:hypothetical protein
MKSWVLNVLFIAVNFWIYPVMATSLGQVTVADPVLGSRTLVYEKVGEYAVVEDDILLGKLSTLSAKGASILPPVGGARWLNGVVPFELTEDLPLLTKLAALEAIALWQQKTNIQFVELTSKNRDIHPDYLSFIPATGTTCSSFVGRQKGAQVINLAPRCNTMNTVHEIGHALGLWHEQSRIDRDTYVVILWENIDEDHRFNFNQHLTDGQDYGEYDYQSIMHYGAYNFSKNGKKTIIPLMDNVEIGQRDHLSDKDIAAINGMYPDLGG